ncbi:hypothetical protein F6X54_20225 [Micromonospora aurantiaca]|uniref:Secreted protein/lipoprotein n=1 Tax=Micromonospora aurantiaca (nom. illeg.) TaxID=47850 RepID=A0ABQ6UEW8_9ACTN|nr:hypothetical protein [Micromonospora aurantiaca]KAB1109125.1 hypothetical protein F6X54_20225 [Micromonospora aurantiaca]
MKRTASQWGLAAAVALAALLTACTDDRASPPATPTLSAPSPEPASPSSAPPASAETPEQAKQRALDTYLGMQAAFAKAGRIGDPTNPDLSTYATGAALDRLTTALKNRKKDGILARGETVHHPKVTTVSPPDAPTKASVRDCMDSSKSSLYKPNGDAVPQDKGGLRLALATLERTGGTWKVTTFAVREPGTCKL